MPKIVQLTDNQSDYLNRQLGRQNDIMIAQATELNACYVSELRKALKIPAWRDKKWTADMEESLWPLWRKYHDRFKIAEELGVTPNYLAIKLTALRKKGKDVPYMYRTKPCHSYTQQQHSSQLTNTLQNESTMTA